MTLHLSRDEWERIAAEGGGVLFREGQHLCAVPRPGEVHDGVLCRNYLPPAEFVEAAKPCETCHGQRKIRVPYSPIVVEVFNTSLIDCPDCLDGKRRIAVVVPCDFCRGNTPPKNVVAAPCWKCSGQKVLTVGHVVVEWGPWLVVESWVGARANPHKVACLSHNGFLDWRWSSDDLTLVGQYAIGVEVVDQ